MREVAAVWMAARAQLRRRWGATVALALLVGLAGGVVIAAIAGASRTEAAMKRFVAYSRPEEAIVDDTTARSRHLHVGSRVTMWSYSADQNFSVASTGFQQEPPAPAGPAYTFRVVGIVRQVTSVNAPPASSVGNALYDSPG